MSKRVLNRRDFLRSAGIGTAAAVLGDAGHARAAEAPPNVLFIAIDDLNDWIGCYGGHPQTITPNMDRLAKRGVLFRNAHCQAPICNPSRPSLLTGLLPSTTGHYYLQPDFMDVATYRGATTLPAYFAQHGYRTLGTGKIFHGSTDHAPHFDEYGTKGGAAKRPPEKLSYTRGSAAWDWGAFPETDEGVKDYGIAQWGIEQLGKDHGKPYFLAVGFHLPHVPLYVPQKWFDMHPRDKIILPPVLDNDRDDIPQYALDLIVNTVPPPHSWIVEHGEWEHAVQAYLACITFVDHYLGKLLDALDARPDADNTVVVLFSDHGFHLGEKQYWAKRSLWDRATKVPMIISAPGRQADQDCARPVGLIDLYNTLVELCGLPDNPRLEGQSLVPLLDDPARDWPRPALTTFGQNNHALRSERWRYIQYADGSEELYDHQNDANEWNNLALRPEYAEVMAEHRKWLPTVNLPDCPGAAGSGYSASELAKKRSSQEK